MQTIKSVKTVNYEITLVQHDNGKFFVGVECKDKEPVISNGFLDFNTATAIFDAKLLALQGH